MSDIQISRQHQLGKERCETLVREVATRLEERMGGKCRIEGDAVYYEHMGAKGKLVAGEDRVDVSVKLSLLTRAFKPKIESLINKLCDDYIE